MKLTKSILRQLPPLGATDEDPDPLVICKFVFPDFHWAWYAMEFDQKDIFYGFMDGDSSKLGCFSLSDLTFAWKQWGVLVERDLYFTPCRLSELRAQLGR